MVIKVLGVLAALAFFGYLRAATPLPDASYAKLPRWRGFNLPHMYSQAWPDARRGFKEEEIKWIGEWGFNFVRLPLDYHFFIKNNDWTKIDAAAMAQVERVVEWGGKYGVHVCINLHRAPGYCINPPAEPKDLWTNAEAQAVCEAHWRAWAKLLKKYPNERVSFNLFNEPQHVDGATYANVAGRMLRAIQEESPGRLVILDGIEGGTKASPELLKLKTAQALRGYNPFAISHYQAEWAGEWEGVGPPSWPPAGFNGYLYGSLKKELQRPLILRGGFEKGGRLGVHVNTVSQEGTLLVQADGKTVLRHVFKPGPGQGEWKESKFSEQWKIYQNRYDKPYEAKIPKRAKIVTVTLIEGDWLTLKSVTVHPEGQRPVEISSAGQSWGIEPGTLQLNKDGTPVTSKTARADAVESLLRAPLKPWIALRDSGVGVMVGEMGAYNKTPHPVVLAWMEDQLKLYKEAGLGWALWNFSGSFGVLDSERADVKYVDWHGHKLDKKLLEVLRKY